MRLQRENFDIFAKPIFLVALLVLVINDFWLKTLYPNWLTGKLSDFAGLYVFVQFFAAVTGFQVVRVAIASGVLFVAWKSPAASSLIELVNSYSPLKIQRTIDYTDLIALSVIPFAVRLYTAKTNFRITFLKYPAAAIAMLAIMATSTPRPPYRVNLNFQNLNDREMSIDNIYAEVDKLLAQRGLRCVDCTAGSGFRKYHLDANKHIAALFNYDKADRTLFVYIYAHSFEISREQLDELHAGLMDLLRQRFEKIKVVDAAPNYYNIASFGWEIKIYASSATFPLSCEDKGINHPQIAKALSIFDEVVSFPIEMDIRTKGCSEVSPCSLGTCRDVWLGHVTGPYQFNRTINASSHVNAGWSGTTLYFKITDYGNVQETERIVDDLEKRLRTSLSGEIAITVTKIVE